MLSYLSIIAGLLGGFFSAIGVAFTVLTGGAGAIVLIILTVLFTIANIIGLVLFIQGLGEFMPLLANQDTNSVGKIRTAAILNIVGAILAVIPVISLAGVVLNIIAFILMIMAYSALKSSPSFPTKAREGADKLFNAMILNIIAAVCVIIPVIGWIAAFVLRIIAIVFTIKGWAMVRDSDPYIDADRVEVVKIEVEM